MFSKDWYVGDFTIFEDIICFDLGEWCKTKQGGVNSEINSLVSLGFIQVFVIIIHDILWSEKYEVSVGHLFVWECMLEQASLIDSGI